MKPLLDHLDGARARRLDTLVIVTSDHGEAFGEHDNFLHEDLYGETLRVPLILRYPGHLPAGLRIAQGGRLLDLMPTILDLLGLPAPPEIQGQSLAALARGGDGPGPAVTVSEHPPGPDVRSLESVRRDGFTYIVDGAREQLYDVARDPREQVNIASTDPGTTTALRVDLERWRSECAPLAVAVGARGVGPAPDEATVRQLRALGYVE